jgi:hypothetical protein
MAEREYITRSRDPFEAEKEMARHRESLLIQEIIRLKIKCGEEITNEELIERGWGGMPNIYYIGGKRGPDGKFRDSDGNVLER